MAKSLVLSGLLTLRSELIGKIEYAHKQIAKLNSEVVHLEATIRLVVPDFDINTNKPKEYRVRISPFINGELPVLIMDALRQSALPLSTTEIAYCIAKAKGLGEDKDYNRVVKPVHGALQRMRSRGMVEAIGKASSSGNAAFLWQLIG